MSLPGAIVHVDLEGQTHEVGSLWVSNSRRGTVTAAFRYADDWLEHPLRFAVDPLLDLTSGGIFHKDRLFGAIADSAPDRWGRTLVLCCRSL